MRRAPEWEGAYCEYFAARRGAFMRTAYAILGSWPTAEDATQATFTKLYVYWPRIKDASVDAYARRVLVNTCIETSRKSKREIVSEHVPERGQTGAYDVRLDLMAALRRLSPRDRAVLALRFLDDLSVTDVAAVLQLPPGTVKSQTARAIARLEAILTEPTNQNDQTDQGVHHAH